MRWLILYLSVLTAVDNGLWAQGDHRGWRGDGKGYYGAADPPVEWSPSRNVAWKTEMPSWSNGSPVLASDSLVVVCSEPDRVLGVDRRRGNIVWQQSLGDVAPDLQVQTHQANGYTSPTPVSDGRAVYTLFGSGVAAAHDLDGNRLWARLVDRPPHQWGHSASPVLGGERLIVHIADLVALDPATGEVVWRQASQVKFGSPVVTRIGPEDVVITPSGDVFRARDGEPLARQIGNLEYATPVVHGDMVYFIEKKAVAVKLPAEAGGPFESAWVARVDGSRHYASPLIHRGMIYAVSREEKFSILDVETGALVFSRDLDLGTESNSAYASVTLAGGKLFIGADNGTTVVLEPGEGYEEISRNVVEGFRSSPVFAGSRMYLRAFDHLYCFEKN